MKLVLAIGVQVALVFALAASCSITHKSGDFSCTKTADCNTGRDCVEGAQGSGFKFTNPTGQGRCGCVSWVSF